MASWAAMEAQEQHPELMTRRKIFRGLRTTRDLIQFFQRALPCAVATKKLEPPVGSLHLHPKKTALDVLLHFLYRLYHLILSILTQKCLYHSARYSK